MAAWKNGMALIVIGMSLASGPALAQSDGEDTLDSTDTFCGTITDARNVFKETCNETNVESPAKEALCGIWGAVDDYALEPMENECRGTGSSEGRGAVIEW